MTKNREALRAWLSLLAASNGLKKAVDTRFRNQFGLSIARFDVLSALERAGDEGLRAGALTRRLMVTEGNTTQVTAPLIRDGLVVRCIDPADGRAAIFRITREGERLFAEMAKAHGAWIDQAFSNMSASQLKALRRLLNRITMPVEDAASGKDAA